MRWLTFILLVALLLTLQSVLAPLFEVAGIRPDGLLVVVVFFALYAKPDDAVIGGSVIGLGADLMTVERLGFLALSYCLAAALVASVRDHLFRYRAATQLLVTFAVSLLLQTAWTGYRRIGYGAVDSLLWDWLWGGWATAVYTAAWAPLVHGVLLRMSRWLGIPRPRYSHAGLHAAGSVDV